MLLEDMYVGMYIIYLMSKAVYIETETYSEDSNV